MNMLGLIACYSTFLPASQSQGYVTTDGLSTSLSWNKAPIWGLRPDSYYCQTVPGLLWDSLSREDGSAIYNCCWPSPAQSFSDLSPLGLATIFYCLRFATSLFVNSYHSQGYGGVIRPRLQKGVLSANQLLVLS
jgi:hypothetical protein